MLSVTPRRLHTGHIFFGLRFVGLPLLLFVLAAASWCLCICSADTYIDVLLLQCSLLAPLLLAPLLLMLLKMLLSANSHLVMAALVLLPLLLLTLLGAPAPASASAATRAVSSPGSLLCPLAL